MHPRDFPMPDIACNRALVRSVSILPCYPAPGDGIGVGLLVVKNKQGVKKYDLCGALCGESNRYESLRDLAASALYHQAGIGSPLLTIDNNDVERHFLRVVGYNTNAHRLVCWFDSLVRPHNDLPKRYAIVNPAALRKRDFVPQAIEDIDLFRGYCAAHGLQLPWFQGMTSGRYGQSRNVIPVSAPHATTRKV